MDIEYEININMLGKCISINSINNNYCQYTKIETQNDNELEIRPNSPFSKIIQ